MSQLCHFVVEVKNVQKKSPTEVGEVINSQNRPNSYY